MRESKQERFERRGKALEANAARLRKKLERKGDHPSSAEWARKLEATDAALKIRELQTQIDRLQKPGDHNVEVPAGSMSAKGK